MEKIVPITLVAYISIFRDIFVDYFEKREYHFEARSNFTYRYCANEFACG